MKTSEARRALQLCAPVGEWANIEAAAGTEAAPLRRFSMVAYTGGAMALAGWPHPVVVDLAGLQISARSRPILKDHNRSLIVGHTDSVAVQGSNLLVTGVISGAGPVAREIVESSRNGFPWQASLGALAERVELVPKGRKAAANGREFEGPVHIARKATLGEISFVALGADEDTSAQVAATAADIKEDVMDFEKWLEAKGFVAADLSDAQRASLQAMYDAEQKRPGTQGDPTNDASDAADDGKPTDGADVVSELRAQAAAETKRIAEIRRLCAGKHADIEAKAIEEGWDAPRTELELLRVQRPTVTGVRRGAEPPTGKALEAALLLNYNIAPEDRVAKWYDARTMEAALSRDLRRAGLHTVFHEIIRAAGGHAAVAGFDDDTIRAAFVAEQRLIQAAYGFSTISLSGILSNVANKAMLAAYEAVESVVAQFCSETDVNDFKEVTRYRLTGNGVFERVGPDGELKHATLTEESYKNRIETFGRMIALTRQMIINDDLGAFLQIPRIIGRMSALKREEAVFELLLSNPSSFFSTTNKNYISGADTALSIDALEMAEQKFLDQTDVDGKPILIRPALLLVPTSLAVTARRLFNETRVNETTDTGKPKPADNPFAGMFRPAVSPYLNAQGLAGSSAKAWYLFASPADVAAIEVAYLRGRRTPTIESGETSFNTLGMQWRGYFDFGVALQDFRAAVKSKGEA
ncbi:MAG: Mu-like prophage major head subunit gpT family protein [Planctomycetes bacterium]|nr:Mu-like prophage major head subunit gpT family protein [Planctomycetota bacterium]